MAWKGREGGCCPDGSDGFLIEDFVPGIFHEFYLDDFSFFGKAEDYHQFPFKKPFQRIRWIFPVKPDPLFNEFRIGLISFILGIQ